MDAAPPATPPKPTRKYGLAVGHRDPEDNCRAMSKHTRQRCKQPPSPGKTLCRFHGAKTEKVPNRHAMTHGATSKYYSKAELPEVIERMRRLDKTDGRIEATKLGHALTEIRSEAIPEDPEFADTFVKARNSMRQDVALLDQLEKKDASPVMPVFQIATYDNQANQSFLGRSYEGPVTIRLIDSQPFMLDADTGAWFPSAKLIDTDTGAEVYTRLLTAKDSK